MRYHRNGTTTPKSPIEKLAAAFRETLHLPDARPLYTLAGCVAGNMIEGPPINLMMVGPPSCGKTELLNSILTVPHIVEGGEIGGEAAFLSATPTKDKKRTATGGLLREIGDAGGFVINDFATVMTHSKDKFTKIMGIFRELYQGRWTRHVGTEGGLKLHWEGKLAVFAGVTGAIDLHHHVSAELGERWIFYRFEERDAFAECMLAMSRQREQGWKAHLRELMRAFFADLELGFDELSPAREPRLDEKVKLQHYANLVTRCRSSVHRDPYTREITAPLEREMPTRLCMILTQLYLGLDRIGTPEGARWRLIYKIAMDSMPRARALAIEAARKGTLSVVDLATYLGSSESFARRTVEDLEVHEVLRRENGKICFSEWMEYNYAKFPPTAPISDLMQL